VRSDESTVLAPPQKVDLTALTESWKAQWAENGQGKEERKKLQVPSSCRVFGKISLLKKSRARRG
jgi:hypothetical protein